MLNALYQYAVERQLALPVGFVAKTVKAFLCLGADGRFLGLERSDGRPYAAPDIGSLANSTSRCNPLVEKAGTESYPGLVAAAGFESPFREGTLRRLGGEVADWIEQQDRTLQKNM